MAGGRPSKYSEAYCNEVIECLGQGHSVTAFAGQIGVARSTVFKWAEEHKEFSDALKVGQAKAVSFWEVILADVARNGKGNATAVIFALKNRAADDWADKVVTEHTGKDGGAIALETKDMTDQEVGRRLAFLLARASRAEKPKP
jgi:transposase-like protein